MKDFRDLLSDSKSWSAKRRVFLHSIMGLMSRPVYKHESGWHSRNAYDCYAGDVVHEFMYCQESERLMAELEVADISLSDLQEHVVAYASENHPSVLEWFDSRWMASQNFIAVSLEIFGYISSMSEGAIDMYLQNINSEPGKCSILLWSRITPSPKAYGRLWRGVKIFQPCFFNVCSGLGDAPAQHSTRSGVML